MNRLILMPTATHTMKVIHDSIDGTWYIGAEFLRGRGRSFNGYVKYVLKDGTGRELWRGWPAGAPDPCDPSDTRGLYQAIARKPRFLRWLQDKIEAAQARGEE